VAAERADRHGTPTMKQPVLDRCQLTAEKVHGTALGMESASSDASFARRQLVRQRVPTEDAKRGIEQAVARMRSQERHRYGRLGPPMLFGGQDAHQECGAKTSDLWNLEMNLVMQCHLDC
jgi:hypothetical protein